MRLPAETARLRHMENALAAGPDQAELVRRLLERQGSRPPGSGVLSAQSIAGRYAGRLAARIRARTLVLHGGADTVVDPRNGRLLAARIPGARLVTFPGLGHLLFWEDPDGFAAAVASFLLAPRPDRDIGCSKGGADDGFVLGQARGGDRRWLRHGP